MRVQALERDIQKAALEFLNILPGARFWRRNVIAVPAEYNGKKRFIRAGQAGQSDLWGLYYGVHCEIEIKRPGEKPTESQAQWIEEIRRLGGIAFWIDSTEDLDKKLRDELVLTVRRTRDDC